MHINATLDRPGFAEIILGSFRAIVRNERVDAIRAYLGLSPKQLVRKATAARGAVSRYSSGTDYQRKPVDALRAGIKSWSYANPLRWHLTPSGGETLKAEVQCLRPAAELAREVACSPYSQLCFWSYCWAYASAREGLHVFDDSITTTEEI